MKNDSAVLDRELERDTHRARPERNASAPRSTGENLSSSKRSLGDRIKGAFANLAKALEGDHGSHHYRS